MKNLVDQVKQVIVVVYWNRNDILSILLLEPGIVAKLTVSNTTVMWGPPEEPNGVITGYEVIYFEYDKDTQAQEVQLDPSQTMFTHIMSNLSKKSM